MFERATRQIETLGYLKKLKAVPAEKRAALYGIAMLAGRGHFAGWAFGDRSGPGSEITSISQRVELYAEYRAYRETAHRNALIRDSRGASHLHAPRDRFSIAPPHWLSIRSERYKVHLGMIGLSDKSRHDSCPDDSFGLVVHRKRVV